MGSTFSGFGIAKSGLFAAQNALNTVSHNIANANTEGYTRQVLNTHASSPDIFPGVPGVMGTGVESENIKQIRVDYLDNKFRGRNTELGAWDVKRNTLETVEAIFNEPSDSGITKLLDNYFSALQELNKAPESLTTRSLFRQRSIALSKGIIGMNTSLKREQKNIDFEIGVVVSDLNGKSQQISELNKSIYMTELDGKVANDLRDQRNLLLDEMSELVDIDYYEDSKNRFYVNLNGHGLVSHYDSDTLELVERKEKINETDVERLSDIGWTSGSTFNSKGGKLNALIAMRDNVSGMDKGIPYYVEKLNEFADTLVTEMNMVHSKGYDLSGETGIKLFTVNGMSTEEYNAFLVESGLNEGPAIDVTSAVISGINDTLTDEEQDKLTHDNITAIKENTPGYENKSIKYISGKYYLVDRIKTENLTISDDVESDLDKFAASGIAASGGAQGDGKNALAMAEIRHNVSLYAWGSPDDFVKSLISNLGVDTQEAKRMQASEEVLINQVDGMRQSISGVSLDEEMAEMVKYQHAYNASARMINVIDEMIDLIVNRLGSGR